jgi:CheY-like chemotaxis protein/two-component sensor histidine kinase
MLAYSGKGKFVIEQVDINLMIEEIATLLKVTIPKGTKLKFDFEENLPPTSGDASQLRQVIMNLITNAAEAIGEKGGEVRLITKQTHLDSEFLSETFLDDDIPPGDYISLEVSDNGCGMDKETLASLFDPFFTTKFTGRGLGMAAVLGIVRGHKGAIKVYSEPGLGTTFKIYYPAMPADKIVATPQKTENSLPTTERVTLLLVDDEPAILDLGQRMLERTGYIVLTAGGGKEAISVFSKNRDDIRCVVLDLTMPDMGGEETFMELLKIKKSVKVIMTSGYNEQEVTQKFVGKGIAGFIQKPYRRKDIAEKIESALFDL